MHVQPKVRNFLWRAIRNSIPTKINLKRRMVLMDECCDHCHEEPEDVLHALWSCPSISQAWTQFDTWRILDPSPCFSSFKDLVETVVEEGKDLNCFATTVWAIWSRRNSMRTSGQHIPVQQIYSEVQKARAAYVRTIPPRPPDQANHCEQRSTWKPPPRSKLKINFDGSVFNEVQRAGVGAIVRDAEGSVLASMAESFHLPFSIAAVEVIAAMKTIQFAKDLGLTSFILEGDSKNVIEGLKCDMLIFGHIRPAAKRNDGKWQDGFEVFMRNIYWKLETVMSVIFVVKVDDDGYLYGRGRELSRD
ncbi:hypothetical protein CFP56_005898 [Quercus suber]|uniref:Reverse transcriptase zinc-binding domain-containing protein n=1 Tax=Quercus suber TaxID=58331 RepID=A0AAW0M6H3_QUESU